MYCRCTWDCPSIRARSPILVIASSIVWFKFDFFRNRRDMPCILMTMAAVRLQVGICACFISYVLEGGAGDTNGRPQSFVDFQTSTQSSQLDVRTCNHVDGDIKVDSFLHGQTQNSAYLSVMCELRLRATHSCNTGPAKSNTCTSCAMALIATRSEEYCQWFTIVWSGGTRKCSRWILRNVPKQERYELVVILLRDGGRSHCKLVPSRLRCRRRNIHGAQLDPHPFGIHLAPRRRAVAI